MQLFEALGYCLIDCGVLVGGWLLSGYVSFSASGKAGRTAARMTHTVNDIRLTSMYLAHRCEPLITGISSSQILFRVLPRLGAFLREKYLFDILLIV